MIFKSKLALGAIALCVIAGAAGVAASQEAASSSTAAPPTHWRPHPRPGMMIGGGFLIALRQLNLTASQQQQIGTILHDARAQRAADRGADRSEFLVLANPGDPNYATALQNAEQRATARIEQASAVELKIYNVLTPEQQQALPGVLSNLQASRHWQHGAPPPAAPPAG